MRGRVERGCVGEEAGGVSGRGEGGCGEEGEEDEGRGVWGELCGGGQGVWGRRGSIW